MQALHNVTGKLPWKDIFQPAIRIAREGFTIGPNLAAALANNVNVLNLSPALSFGSGFETSSGLLLNNYMDAFAKPGKPFGLDPSPANKLAPGKRPMTSMVPTVITAGATPSPLVGALGGSGGLPTISAMAQAHLLRKLGYTVTEKTIASAATGIAVLKTGLLLAPNDTKHVDGSRSGE
ncbi:hypothetical protein MTO96_038959 [Rhipicephalus appendiculatus]